MLSYCRVSYLLVFFFFQAEDGIRDRNVTGVQTCALPIFPPHAREVMARWNDELSVIPTRHHLPRMRWNIIRALEQVGILRSEERRVGKECRSRWWREYWK